MGYRTWIPLWLLLWPGILITAQTPFDCNGRLFRVIEKGGGTTFQEILIDYDNTGVDFVDKATFPGWRVNGIAYRFIDDLIYGVLLTKPYGLARIDGDYNIERMADLPFPENMLFVSGDITPDGKYLVLLGYSSLDRKNILAMVDLESPDYHTQMLTLSPTDSSIPVYCADIAFHPTTKILYGFDHSSKRIITVDIENRQIDNTSYPTLQNLQGVMPSIFFDAFGNLFGVGTPRETNAPRAFYRLDVDTGLADLIENMEFEGNQDGCSCPYQVNLYNTISSRDNYPCTDAIFTLKIRNKTPFEQELVDLRDTFPMGTHIKEILHQPFGGTITSGVGSRILNIEDMTLPVGTDSIVVAVNIEQNIPDGFYENQAYLHDVEAYDFKGLTVVSDDPETASFDDPTRFEVHNLRVNFNRNVALICPEQPTTLDPRISGAEYYKWSTGEETQTITVSEPGTYSVTINSGCEEATGSIEVRTTEVTVELGEDRSVEQGELIEFNPVVQSEAPISAFRWSVSDPNAVSCESCPEGLVRTNKETKVYLEVENKLGCLAQDEVLVRVTPFRAYIPNAFSPNGDEINDIFYVHGRTEYRVETFKIFDRWGNMLFQGGACETDDKTCGWDGRYNGKMMDTGVYVYFVELEAKNNRLITFTGDLTLSK